MKRVASALCLILCSATFAAADGDFFKTAPLDPEPFDKIPPGELHPKFEQTVELCIKVVRGELPHSQFDAYVEGNSVNMMGTEDSRFKFYKCMSKNGLPLSPGKESER